MFSLQLGQTYSYYFDRQGAIQDAAFREVSGLQRLLELSLSFANSRGLLPSDGSASSATALGLLEELEAEVASLAPGGDGLTSTTQLVVKNEKRALQRLLDGLNKLSADDDDKNDPATVASLNAAQHAATAVSDARALRVSQINADLPPAQFLTLTVLAMLLLGSFLLTDLKNDKLEAALFGAIAGAAALFKQVLLDLSSPFSGSWSVDPARQAAADLLQIVRSETANATAGGAPAGVQEAAPAPTAQVRARPARSAHSPARRG